MEAKVIIENGKTRIELTPDNEFETEVIERVRDEKYKISTTSVHADYSFNTHSNHKITINIEKS